MNDGIVRCQRIIGHRRLMNRRALATIVHDKNHIRWIFGEYLIFYHRHISSIIIDYRTWTNLLFFPFILSFRWWLTYWEALWQLNGWDIPERCERKGATGGGGERERWGNSERTYTKSHLNLISWRQNNRRYWIKKNMHTYIHTTNTIDCDAEWVRDLSKKKNGEKNMRRQIIDVVKKRAPVFHRRLDFKDYQHFM